MKDWFKKIEIDQYDILIQRRSNQEDGEHLKVTIRDEVVDFSVNITYEDSNNADKAFDEDSEYLATTTLGYLNNNILS